MQEEKTLLSYILTITPFYSRLSLFSSITPDRHGLSAKSPLFAQLITLYLIMSYMPGTPLGSVWNSLLESEKSDILMQLRSTFNQMRLILATNIFSSVCGGPLPYHWFWWIKPEPAITGPFQTEEDLSQALALRSLRNHEFHGNENRSRLPEFFARHLPNVLRRHTFPLLATELRGGFGLALL